MRYQLRLTFCALLGVFSLVSSTGISAETTPVKVKFLWDGDGFPAEMKVYELKKGVNLPLWTTGATDDKNLPIGKEIPNEKGMMMKRGATQRFVLSLKNSTKKDLYFFATPHTVDPAKHSLGFDFRCLCLNHAYHAPAGKTWYRVVTLQLDPEFSGKSVEVKHALIPVSKQRAEQVKTKGAEVPPPKI